MGKGYWATAAGKGARQLWVFGYVHFNFKAIYLLPLRAGEGLVSFVTAPISVMVSGIVLVL